MLKKIYDYIVEWDDAKNEQNIKKQCTMATVRMLLKHTDQPSEEQLETLHEAKNRPIVFDEESPEMTDEMLAQFRRVHPKEGFVSNAT